MGSPGDEPKRGPDEAQVRVTIAKPFAAGEYAVTFDKWHACVADGECGGHEPSDEGWGRGWRPVINVSWDDAQRYVSWISRKTGKTYRLLSKTEREYVTRAGTTTAFWWGSSITPKQAHYQYSPLVRQTLPVDSFAPNPWGLYNVHGNVWEWTEDCWNVSNSGNPRDGSARTSGDCSGRVLRGSSWSNGSQRNLRAAARDWKNSGSGGNSVGFRLARTLTP
jgi:formylglycine-generating enzyme required for sulfatase activity